MSILKIPNLSVNRCKHEANYILQKEIIIFLFHIFATCCYNTLEHVEKCEDIPSLAKQATRHPKKNMASSWAVAW
jgi:hypothetical protein